MVFWNRGSSVFLKPSIPGIFYFGHCLNLCQIILVLLISCECQFIVEYGSDPPVRGALWAWVSLLVGDNLLQSPRSASAYLRPR